MVPGSVRHSASMGRRVTDGRIDGLTGHSSAGATQWAILKQSGIPEDQIPDFRCARRPEAVKTHCAAAASSSACRCTRAARGPCSPLPPPTHAPARAIAADTDGAPAGRPLTSACRHLPTGPSAPSPQELGALAGLLPPASAARHHRHGLRRGLAPRLHHHGRQPLLRLLCGLAVRDAVQGGQDHQGQAVRRRPAPARHRDLHTTARALQQRYARARLAHRSHTCKSASAPPCLPAPPGLTRPCAPPPRLSYAVYSPLDGQPCADHDRATGEGVGPQVRRGRAGAHGGAERVCAGAG